MLPKFKTSQERLKYFYNHYHATLFTINLHSPNHAGVIKDYVTELESRLLQAIKTLEEMENGSAAYSSVVYDEADLHHNIQSVAAGCLDQIRI